MCGERGRPCRTQSLLNTSLLPDDSSFCAQSSADFVLFSLTAEMGNLESSLFPFNGIIQPLSVLCHLLVLVTETDGLGPPSPGQLSLGPNSPGPFLSLGPNIPGPILSLGPNPPRPLLSLGPNVPGTCISLAPDSCANYTDWVPLLHTVYGALGSELDQDPSHISSLPEMTHLCYSGQNPFECPAPKHVPPLLASNPRQPCLSSRTQEAPPHLDPSLTERDPLPHLGPSFTWNPPFYHLSCHPRSTRVC